MNHTVDRVYMNQTGISDLETASVFRDIGRRTTRMYEIVVADIARRRDAVRLPPTPLRVLPILPRHRAAIVEYEACHRAKKYIDGRFRALRENLQTSQFPIQYARSWYRELYDHLEARAFLGSLEELGRETFP
jgi:hypothetical protein